MPAKRRAKPRLRCCKQCRKRVPLSKMKKLRSGRAGICQKCDAANARTKYWANAAATRHYRRSLRQRNPEGYRAAAHAYYWRNVAKVRRQQRDRGRTERMRAVNKAAVARWRARNADKDQAARAVRAAIRAGVLRRPKVCDVVRCRSRARDAHHNSYSRKHRLRVAFLCPVHHREAHRRRPLPLRKGAAFKFAKAPPKRQRA